MNDNNELIQVGTIIRQLEQKAQRQADAHAATLRHLELIRAQRDQLEKKATAKR